MHKSNTATRARKKGFSLHLQVSLLILKLLYNHAESRKIKTTTSYKATLELNMRDKEVGRPGLGLYAGRTPVEKAGLQVDQACGVTEELAGTKHVEL